MKAKALIVHWWYADDSRSTSVHIVNNDEDVKKFLSRGTEIEDYEVVDLYDARNGVDKNFE